MAITVCRPAQALPAHTITIDEICGLVADRHATHPRLQAVLRVMRSTQVATRRSVMPFEQLVAPPTLGKRMEVYQREATALARDAAWAAIKQEGLCPDDIDAIVTVSVTGHAVPPLDAHLVNLLGLRRTVRRHPVNQMGCAGGAYALVRAAADLAAHPGQTVLVVAVELSSLSYHPDDVSMASFVANALFGDGAIACIVRGGGRAAGPVLGRAFEHLLPGTLDDVTYILDERGHHFVTTPVVRDIVKDVAPDLMRFLRDTTPPGQGWQPEWLVSHTGGPRVLDGLVECLGCAPSLVRNSYASLAERGNIASASVLDVLVRTFDDPPPHGSHGLLIGFGPGFTTVAARATWDDNGASGPTH